MGHVFIDFSEKLEHSSILIFPENSEEEQKRNILMKSSYITDKCPPSSCKTCSTNDIGSSLKLLWIYEYFHFNWSSALYCIVKIKNEHLLDIIVSS